MLFALLFLTLLFSLQSLFCKLYAGHTTQTDHAVVPVVFSVFYGVFTALATFCFAGFRFSPSAQTLWIGILNGAMLFLYNFSLIRASDQGSYAFTLISALFGGVILPMFASAVLWHERLTLLQWIGTAITLISFWVINADSISLKGAGRSFFFWCLCLFLANGLYSVLMAAQQRALAGMQRSEMIIVTFAVSALIAFVYLAVTKRRETGLAFRTGRKGGLFAVLSCIIATAATNLYVYLLSHINLSVLSAVNNGGTLILSVFYAFLLFHEKPSSIRIAGMALSLIGIILLSI